MDEGLVLPGQGGPQECDLVPLPQQHTSVSISNKKEAEWSSEAVINLLDIYELKWAELNHGYLKKKHWDEVAAEVSAKCAEMGAVQQKTGAQCKSKIEKLKRRYRHEKASDLLGSSKWAWLQRMDSMMSNAPQMTSIVDSYEKLAEKEGCGSSIGGSWYRVPDLCLRDHYFVVPLDYSSPNGPSLTLFAREVVAAGKEEKELPYLLFLQGGPGFESPRPLESNGWLKRAVEDYRVILLDQRGTGLSTALTSGSLGQLKNAKEQAAYLQHFRADNIVRDAEFVRSCLLGNGEPWTVLGQSYGGFCAVTYLSLAPAGLQEVLLTGGLPPLEVGCSAETVYHACFKRVLVQNLKFYERFPQDEENIRQVVLHLVEAESGGVQLPSGGKLTPRLLQALGLCLGSYGGFERLHYLFERAWEALLIPGAKKQLSHAFLRMVENFLDFDTNPLYAVMHESIYCQGAASRWAANRVRDNLEDRFDAVTAARNGQPVLFTGEMVFPWIFDEIEALKPLKEAAHILAEKDDWPFLYNTEVLRNNKVPVAAAVYYEDMYVNFNLSEATANQISGIRLWITNEYMHSGIREDGGRVIDKLIGMVKGKNPLH